MIHRPHARRAVNRDPADWSWSIRLADGRWLARPAPQPDAPPSNAETWTRRLADVWAFDSQRDAETAAAAHGADKDGFTVHCVPRRGGQWLKGEGAYGGKPVTTRITVAI